MSGAIWWDNSCTAQAAKSGPWQVLCWGVWVTFILGGKQRGRVTAPGVLSWQRHPLAPLPQPPHGWGGWKQPCSHCQPHTLRATGRHAPHLSLLREKLQAAVRGHGVRCGGRARWKKLLVSLGYDLSPPKGPHSGHRLPTGCGVAGGGQAGPVGHRGPYLHLVVRGLWNRLGRWDLPCFWVLPGCQSLWSAYCVVHPQRVHKEWVIKHGNVRCLP